MAPMLHAPLTTKVVALVELLDGDFPARRVTLDSDGVNALNQEELVTGFALDDNVLSRLESAGLEHVGDLGWLARYVPWLRPGDVSTRVGAHKECTYTTCDRQPPICQ